MKKVNNSKFLCILLFALFVWFFSCPVFASEITIVGEVNDTYQVVADGQIYEVAVTPKGDDLVFNYMAVKVKVKQSGCYGGLLLIRLMVLSVIMMITKVK